MILSGILKSVTMKINENEHERTLYVNRLDFAEILGERKDTWFDNVVSFDIQY